MAPTQRRVRRCGSPTPVGSTRAAAGAAGSPGRSETLDIRLVSEDGQWRIDNPMNALVVPTSFFDRSFARFNLYFYDQTGRVAAARSGVHPARGADRHQPGPRPARRSRARPLAEISRSALPVAAPTSTSRSWSPRAGSPRCRSRARCCRPHPTSFRRAVDQLAWTLRQVPGIERVRITVGGAPVPLPGGRIDAPGDLGLGVRRRWHRRTPSCGDCEAVAWSTSRRAAERTERGRPARRPGYSMRSLAVSESPRTIAAVSGNGTTVFVAPAEGGDDVDAGDAAGRRRHRPAASVVRHVRRPVAGRPHGARRASARRQRRPGPPRSCPRSHRAPTWQRSRSRATAAGWPWPTPAARPRAVRVIDILRTDEGIVSGAGRSQDVPAGRRRRRPDRRHRLARPGHPGGAEPPAAETSEVSFISSDGSPTLPDPDRAERLPGRCPGDGGRPRRLPAAAPDHARPAALHPEQQRRLAADELQGRRREPTRADRLASTPRQTARGLHSRARVRALPASARDGHAARRARRLARPRARRRCVGCADARPVAVRGVRGTAARARAGRCVRRRARRPGGLLRRGEYDELLRAMVLAHKEHGTFSLAAPAGPLLAAAATCALDPTGAPFSCPCPHGRRWSARAGTTRCSGSPGRPHGACGADRPSRAVGQVLEQRGAVHDQAGLDAGQRAANLAGSMGVRAAGAARSPAPTQPSRCCVCDDVLTTGATAREAQRALEDSGLRVRAVVTVAATRKRLPPGQCADGPEGPTAFRCRDLTSGTWSTTGPAILTECPDETEPLVAEHSGSRDVSAARMAHSAQIAG